MHLLPACHLFLFPLKLTHAESLTKGDDQNTDPEGKHGYFATDAVTVAGIIRVAQLRLHTHRQAHTQQQSAASTSEWRF